MELHHRHQRYERCVLLLNYPAVNWRLEKCSNLRLSLFRGALGPSQLSRQIGTATRIRTERTFILSERCLPDCIIAAWCRSPASNEKHSGLSGADMPIPFRSALASRKRIELSVNDLGNRIPSVGRDMESSSGVEPLSVRLEGAGPKSVGEDIGADDEN